jgi:prophage regulatory protein
MALTTHSILRRRTVEKVSGYSRSSLYRRIGDGTWPPPVSIGPRSVGWPSDEVHAVIAARVRGSTHAQIKRLVDDLLKVRHAQV